MERIEMKIKLLSDKAITPTKAYEHASGLDLYTAVKTVVEPRSTAKIPTDVAVKLPANTDGTIRNRSGVTAKTKLRVALGTIDNDYTGNLYITVDNIGDEPITIEAGYKLAQLVVTPVYYPTIELVDELEETERGTKGYGSTGVYVHDYREGSA